MTQCIRILFVDDEPNVLLGLKRTLRQLRKQWDMHFVTGGADALELLQQQEYDVVVSDMRMPGMDGSQLLRRVKEQHPHIVRIVLSGYGDRNMTLRSVNSAHQYLAKPCDSEVLRQTVDRALALRQYLNDKAMRRLVCQIEVLPSPPHVYTALNNLLESPDTGPHDVGQVIQADPALTIKVLKLVNSSFFGLRRNVTNVGEAVTLLGLELVKSLIASLHLTAAERQSCPLLDSIAAHSLRTAHSARSIISRETEDSKQACIAFTAGLLHDAGKLVLYAGLGEQYSQLISLAQQQHLPLAAVELKELGATHAQVGAYLLGLWGLPDSIIEAIAYHHQPSQCINGSVGPLCAVHIADVFDHELYGQQPHTDCAALDEDYLTTTAITPRLDTWRQWITQLRDDAEAA